MNGCVCVAPDQSRDTRRSALKSGAYCTASGASVSDGRGNERRGFLLVGQEEIITPSP